MTDNIRLRVQYAKIDRVVKCQLDILGINSYPVPIEKIVKYYRIDLRYGDFRTKTGEIISGMLVRKDDSVVIGINSSQLLGRRRFTIAHELGHFLLHEGSSHFDQNYRVNFRNSLSSQAIDIVEIEANYFAANLLMPKKMLDDALAFDAIDNDIAVKKLAKEFQVSQHAMSLRLAKVYQDFSPF